MKISYLIFFLYISNIIFSQLTESEESKDEVKEGGSDEVDPEVEQFNLLKKVEISQKLEEKPVLQCHPELLITLGYSMRVEPIEVKLDFCPQITQSCCDVSDQKEIWSNLIYSKEKKNLEDRFDWYEQIFDDLYKELSRVKIWSERVDHVLQTKQVSNCKIITKKLSQFQIDYVFPKVLQNLRFLYGYFKDMFLGIYCAVCDAKKHRFFNIEKNEVQISKSICRDQIQESLVPLMYLHVQLNDYLNLVSQFLNSCNYKGDYKFVRVPGYQRFHVVKEIKEKLDNCFKYVNTIDWFESCVIICDHVNLVKFESFFTPNIKKFVNYTDFLKKQLEDWDEFYDDYLFFLKTKNIQKKKTIKLKTQRILTQNDSSQNNNQQNQNNNQNNNQQNQNNQSNSEALKSIKSTDITKVDNLEKFQDPVIFKFAYGGLVNLQKMKIKFDNIGLDLKQSTKESVITINTYKEVLKILGEEENKQNNQTQGNISLQQGSSSQQQGNVSQLQGNVSQQGEAGNQQQQANTQQNTQTQSSTDSKRQLKLTLTSSENIIFIVNLFYFTLF